MRSEDVNCKYTLKSYNDYFMGSLLRFRENMSCKLIANNEVTRQKKLNLFTQSLVRHLT